MANMTYSSAVISTIAAEMRRDPTIFRYGTGVGNQALIEEFGWAREDYTGICENQEAGAGIGAALMGMRPIVNLGMMNFALDAAFQLAVMAPTVRFKEAYRVNCPVVFQISYGSLDTAHHSACFHNWIANMPNMFVSVASTAADAVGLWRTALRETKDPVVMLSDGLIGNITGDVPDGDYTIPFGVADIKRQGTDVTIAAMGYTLQLALQAADDLAKQGISAEVWDPRTLAPFDRKSLITSVTKTGAMVVVDVAPKSFGATGEFFATVGEALTPIPPMARVASMDLPIGFSYGKPTPLVDYVRPSKDKIISAVQAVLARKSGTLPAPPPSK